MATTFSRRLMAWLNDPSDPGWERPGPTPAQRRNDVLGMLLFAAVAMLANVLAQSVGDAFGVGADEPAWRSYVAILGMSAPLATRRRAPLVTVLVSSGLFLGLSYLSAQASPQLSFQVAYFAVLYTAVAWARDRRLLWLSMSLVLLTMALWIAVLTTQTLALPDAPTEGDGPLDPRLGFVGYTVLSNMAYFSAALLVGRTSWRGALQRDRATRHAAMIEEQAAELARSAVIDERMRIARELHDVVAHHVSVMGVQAGAARTVLPHDEQAAAEALRGIETSSRQAVGEMRSLLGVLRSEPDGARDGSSGREPEPGLAQLGELTAAACHSGRRVQLTVVERRPGDLDDVPAPIGLSVYRTVQEALSNVAHHSTARNVDVALRTGGEAAQAWVEVEIVDDGRPRPGTSGGGYGLQGIRERVALHGGDAEIGPRATALGWRVRCRFELRHARGMAPAETSGTTTGRAPATEQADA